MPFEDRRRSRKIKRQCGVQEHLATRPLAQHTNSGTTGSHLLERMEIMRGYLKLSLLRIVALSSLTAVGESNGARAQETLSSSISGTVHDPTGAAVIGADVAVKNLANDKVDKAVSDAAGAYRIEGLIPGTYEVTAAKYGFSNSKVRFLLDVRQQFRADMKLRLA